MNKFNKTKFRSALAALMLLVLIVSCGKKTDQTTHQTINEAELETVSNDDFTEKDEDLLTVDYKEFYDKLAPHGEWIEVKGNDIGVDLKKSPATPSVHKSISLSELFGVKAAYADDVDFGAFFVWKPAPELSLGVTAGEPVTYVPYTNGQWVNSSQGWYFRAASEPEEITHHYGRWVLSPSVGWVWVPGRVWSPAWVDWREQDDYIAWEPIPPSIYVVNNVIVPPPVVEERYIIVEKRYFVEPEVYRYVYRENKHKITIKEWRRLDGIMVVNKTVINKGPDVTMIQTYTPYPFGYVTINPVGSIGGVSYTSTQFNVYRPEFKKVKSKNRVSKIITFPKDYVNFNNAKDKHESRKQEKEIGKINGLPTDNNNKNDKGGKDLKNPKYIDDSNMKDGGRKNERNKDGNFDKKNENNGKKENKSHKKNNNNGDRNKSDDKVKQNKGKDNKQNDGNDNGRKNKDNDKKENDKGKKDKGNGKK